MLQIKEIVNSVFASKTYILYVEGGDRAWLVDIGDFGPVVSFCEERGLMVDGVILTHAHFDHIYGLKSLMEHFPGCSVFTNEYGKKMLASDKLNLSRYHGSPFSYEGDNVIVLHEGDRLLLFDGLPKMMIYETPGHNPSCLTLELGDLLFTGDTFIPGVGANTQLPYSDRVQARLSLERVLRLADGKTICPGHGEMKCTELV